MSTVESTPVLIVGGGVSGLSAAAFLAHRGVDCVLVERRHTPATHPRMSDVGPRSMELYRSIGLEDRIRAFDEGRSSEILRVDTLAGREFARFSMGGPEEFGGLTPAGQIWCDQDQLEPVVRAEAEELGADVRTGVELVEFTQDADQVLAIVEDRATGRRHTLSTSYLLACDGAQSPVRERLGIGLSGPGVLAHQAGVLFRADLSAALRGRTFVLCIVDDLVPSGDVGGDHLNVLLWRNLDRWTLSIPFDPTRDDDAAFTEARCVELVRKAVGLDDLAVDVLGVDIWPMRALVADEFRAGRAFLVGDAAHVLPPTGGFGGNSSIDDAHNLAWKLAAVLGGQAGPALLDSYDAERRPMAELHMAESLARAGLFLAGAAEGGAGRPADRPSKASVVLGYRYRSSPAVVSEPDGDDAPVEDPRTPSGRPGTRAAHVELVRDGAPVSTVDLFGPGFVLLAGPAADEWAAAVAAVSADLEVPVTCHRIGAELIDADDRWAGAYGVDVDGAVLVRPDGYIAWRSRSRPDDGVAELRAALNRTLGRDPVVAVD